MATRSVKPPLRWTPPEQKPPCTQAPDWFVQPGEMRGWAEREEARTAVSWCRSRCDPAVFQACARFALTSGWIGVDGTQRPASGVVMAGVVCKGNDATEAQLKALLPQEPPPRPEACVVCKRPMSTKCRHVPGTVVHESQGRCAGCVRAARRQEAS